MATSRVRQSRAAARSNQCGSRRKDRQAAARGLCRDAAATENTLSLEIWASWLFGELWRKRSLVPPDYPECYEMALGASIVDDIVAVGGRGARIALTAIARLDRGELGGYAFLSLDELDDYELPEHVMAVGRATVVQAHATPGDRHGEGLLLGACDADGNAHTIAVFINDDCGGIATQAAVLDSDAVDGALSAQLSAQDLEWGTDGPSFIPTAIGPACRRVRDSLQKTDLLLHPPVSEPFPVYRALALARACTVV